MTAPFTGDRIILKDLGFFGYHGVFAEEAKLGQRLAEAKARIEDDLAGIQPGGRSSGQTCFEPILHGNFLRIFLV